MRRESKQVKIILAPILREFRRRVSELPAFEVPSAIQQAAESLGYTFERVEKPDAYETDD